MCSLPSPNTEQVVCEAVCTVDCITPSSDDYLSSFEELEAFLNSDCPVSTQSAAQTSSTSFERLQAEVVQLGLKMQL